MLETALLLAAAFVAAGRSGAAGFGGALLLLPLLVAVVSVTQAVPSLTLAQLGCRTGPHTTAAFGTLAAVDDVDLHVPGTRSRRNDEDALRMPGPFPGNWLVVAVHAGQRRAYDYGKTVTSPPESLEAFGSVRIGDLTLVSQTIRYLCGSRTFDKSPSAAWSAAITCVQASNRGKALERWHCSWWELTVEMRSWCSTLQVVPTVDS